MPLLKVIVLAAVQGLAELLPVSSSAHVVVAEKLMGLDPSSPRMTLLLVMLHTGTMAAVILYFWKRWRAAFLSSAAAFKRSASLLVLATAITGLVGEALVKVIERALLRGGPHAEVEQLFGHLELIGPALAVVGILILVAGILERRAGPNGFAGSPGVDAKRAGLIGAVQGLCLPFRGFSRSGATISSAMLSGVTKGQAEDFSFALAVILTPPVVAREVLRLVRAERSDELGLVSAFVPGLLGATCAFLTGLLALRWLSRWLENGRWYLFGIYCLAAAGGVALLHSAGF